MLASRMHIRALILLLFVACTARAEDFGSCLVSQARQQVGVTLSYDPAYRRLAFPGGDVPADRGVCTDVLVRAYRLLNVDLQELVHRDMKSSWSAYPKLWGLTRPDPNIDHRRVPNLATFFERHGSQLPIPARPEGYQAGDIVTWRLPSGVPHVGFVSDKASPSGVPLVIHNIGSGTREEDVLLAYTVTGRFRYEPPAAAEACGVKRVSLRPAPRSRSRAAQGLH
jgi:uncharacterized protein YijF (DUF1287 family)